MASITDQNWVVWNQGKNPLVNFNFMLRVELLFDLPCKSVRAFSRELEYDYIQEGGLNDYVHMRRKGATKPFTLEVERYVGVDYVDPMPLGADLVLPVMLFVARNHDQFIPGVVARTYVFTGCTVMKKTYGDLVADQSGLLVETTTLGYREMLCVDIPWSEVGDNIPKDVNFTPAKPSDAKTLSRSIDDYKAMAQQLYVQAETAKNSAETEFQKSEADKLLKELESAITKLEKIAGENGSLEKAVEAAQEGLNGPDGRTKQEIAAELMSQVPPARAVLDEKNIAKRKAERALEAAQKPIDELKKEQTALENELKDNEAIAALNLRVTEANQAIEEKAAQLAEEIAAAADSDTQTTQDGSAEEPQEEATAPTAPEAPEDTPTDPDSSEADGQEADSQEPEEQEPEEKEPDTAQMISDLLTAVKDPQKAVLIPGMAMSIPGMTELLPDIAALAAELDARTKKLPPQDVGPLLEELSTKEIDAKNAEVERLKAQISADEEEAKPTVEAAEAAAAEAEAAREAWQEASDKASAALAEDSAARRALVDAENALRKGADQLRRLQNSNTNLTLRNDKTEQAQKDCAAQYEECKKTNDKVQGSTDEREVYDGYQLVRDLSKDTCYYERQVRETSQYMDAARKQLSIAKQMFPELGT